MEVKDLETVIFYQKRSSHVKDLVVPQTHRLYIMLIHRFCSSPSLERHFS